MSWRETFGQDARLVESVFPGDEALSKLLSSGRTLRVKLGIDLTSTEVTIGNAIPLRILARFQELGHTAVLILGYFTTEVGDPSGRDKTRPVLTRAEVEENGKSWLDQIGKILDLDRAEVRKNSEWLDPLSSAEMVKLAGQMTVAQMLERDSFAKRYATGTPIHLHEFLYSLLQGYDSVAVHADIELGGTDQTFNLNVGRHLQKSAEQRPQVCVLNPLLEGLDGSKKMSKSLGNAIGVDTPAKDMFGRATRVTDELVGKFLRLATRLPDAAIDELLAGDIWHAKKTMAEALTAAYHGDEAAKHERDEFERVFKRKEAPTDLREVPVSGTVTAMAIVRDAFDLSGGEARRRIQQGGVRLDNEKVTDPNAEWTIDSPKVLKAGKTLYVKLVPAD
ncbi:MAG: tyrosine--tRNA ligase [Planctomycetota bacterium]